METFKEWLRMRVPEEASRETYIRGVSGFLSWLGSGTPSAAKLSEYLLGCRARGLKPATERGYENSIHKYFEFLSIPWENGYQPPKLGLRLPKPLSPEEVKSLFARARLEAKDPMGKRNLAMLQILYSCGLRRSELASLTVNDLFFEQRHMVISCGKGKRDRIVPFDLETDAVLRSWLKDRGDPGHPMLWTSNVGKPIKSTSVYDNLRKLSKRAGLENWHPHQMRHTYATFLLNAGCNLRVVQELLGHTSVMATQVYTHVSVEDLRREYAKYHPHKI